MCNIETLCILGLTASQPDKKFPFFCGTRGCITAHCRLPFSLLYVYLYQISPAALPSSPTMEEAFPSKHWLHSTEMNGVTYRKTMALILSVMRTLESRNVHYCFHKSPNWVYILRHAYLIFKTFCNIVLSSKSVFCVTNSLQPLGRLKALFCFICLCFMYHREYCRILYSIS